MSSRAVVQGRIWKCLENYNCAMIIASSHPPTPSPHPPPPLFALWCVIRLSSAIFLSFFVAYKQECMANSGIMDGLVAYSPVCLVFITPSQRNVYFSPLRTPWAFRPDCPFLIVCVVFLERAENIQSKNVQSRSPIRLIELGGFVLLVKRVTAESSNTI